MNNRRKIYIWYQMQFGGGNSKESFPVQTNLSEDQGPRGAVENKKEERKKERKRKIRDTHEWSMHGIGDSVLILVNNKCTQLGLVLSLSP